VVPAYNAEATLRQLAEQLAEVLPQLSRRYELILVNDGSRDHSWPIIECLAQTYPWVRGVNLMRNYGQHNALLCGLRMAQHEITVTMDDDLQHPPAELPKLLARLAEGYDVVYGSPEREQHGLWRNLASRIAKLALQSVLGARTARQVSAYRAIRTPIRTAFETYPGPHVSLDVLLTWGTARFASVPVRHDPRRAGASNYTFRKLMVHAINMLTGFSTAPLRVASLVGFVLMLCGFGIMLYVVGRHVLGGGSGPAFLILGSIIAIFAGAQLFALGVIGEYLALMHVRLMDRPTYTIGQQVRSGGDDREP
jgi:undecaprenyl-phosphate 4-deoxy-4-formamido-L-arabinose transferase